MMRITKRFARLLACVLAITALCLAVAVAEEVVQMTADTQQLIVGMGKTATLKVTVTPNAAHRAGVTYASSDEAIATVDSHGRVKGVALGECQIMVTSKYDESATLEVPVTVVTPITKITAELPEATLHVGANATILCGYEPQDATLQQAVFTSSRESVATVDENGVVTGVGRGQADITVTSADGSAKTRVRVKVTQPPTSITISAKTLKLPIGQTETLRATVLPSNADNKSVTWTSSDESVATVDSHGRVKSISPGTAVITATCVDDPSISANVTIAQVQLAKTVAFGSRQYDVVLGQTTQLDVTVGPDGTSDQSVTYKVKNPRIATVDENGVVTGLKGGKTTVTATTADGSKKHATTTIRVVVPVTGVHFEHHDARVGAGYHTYITAVIEPADATIHDMTWEAEDDSIITVKGDKNKVRVSGRQWGRSLLTGTTADGGFTCSIYIDVGSLRRAVVIETVEIRDGKPYIVLRNKSNMNITSVSYEITGTDGQGNPVRMSRNGDTLTGTYENLAPGERTHHGSFIFNHHTDYPDLQFISMAITGWETDTGYYDHDGNLQYSYRIGEKYREWVSWGSPLYYGSQK